VTWKGCAKSGNSPSKAWKVAKKMQKNGDEVHAYHCDVCGRYHVGYDRVNETGRRKHE
jgi:hypothetical protein